MATTLDIITNIRNKVKERRERLRSRLASIFGRKMSATLVADKTSGIAPLAVNFKVDIQGGKAPYLVELFVNNNKVDSKNIDTQSTTFSYTFNNVGKYTIYAKVIDSSRFG